MDAIEVLWLTGAEEIDQAAGVAARALRDDPDWVAISREGRVRSTLLHAMFAISLPEARVAGVRRDGRVVGVAAAVAPGQCVGAKLPIGDRRMDAPSSDASDEDRLTYFRSVLAAHDLEEPHWHVGPVGVEPGSQSMGIGRAAMGLLCEEFDDHERVSWVKTAKIANVRFYTGFGFEVVDESPMLGVHLWFLRRRPR